MSGVRSSIERNLMSVPVHIWKRQLINQIVVRVHMISILGFIVYRSIYALNFTNGEYYNW
jgi:hypothetical protein